MGIVAGGRRVAAPHDQRSCATGPRLRG